MRKPYPWMLLALPMFIAAFVNAADNTSAGKNQAQHEMNDKFIDERKAALDDLLQKRIDEINNNHSEFGKLETQLKDDRIAFEKKEVEEKKSFLESLKAKPMESRR